MRPDRFHGRAGRAGRPAPLEPFLKSLPGPVLVFVEACCSWEWVSDLCEDLGIHLRLVDPAKTPEIAKSIKKTDAHDVEAACRWMERIEKRIKESVKERDDNKRLQAIPGVGPVIGATILAESAGIGRFPNARKFAAYTGLVPRVRSSMGKTRIVHTSRIAVPRTCAGGSDIRSWWA